MFMWIVKMPGLFWWKIVCELASVGASMGMNEKVCNLSHFCGQVNFYFDE